MASSSSSPPRTWRYRVFTSFHGPDVRKTFLSHLRKQFSCNGISMFDDQEIERSQIIAPALTQAIRESRISIVVLSKNYASSGWCLDELLEILKCKKDMAQIVMTVFYGVDPSDVRKQTGEFGEVFKKTCASKTEKERQNWRKALNEVGNIAGEHFLNWDNESKMIEKIGRDVSNKLNATISWDFEDMVGIEAHLKKMHSLLHWEYEDGALIVGICGPAGLGKTTIARALHSQLSSSFQHNCFMENIRGSYDRSLDDYGLKLSLQEKLLSKILNENGMRIRHLGAIPERLCDQKVLIILDDVDDLKQLEALANQTNWFGPGSRIIVTTEDQELLAQHDINNTYHVDFPTNEVARKMVCRYAFRRSSSPNGFETLVERVTKLCSNLPLGLRVMGSSLRGKSENEWEGILRRLENSVDRKIEEVLRVGYDNLHKDDQLLFLLIAFFFNNESDDHVMAMLNERNLDVILGLKTLAYKSLIQKSTEGNIVMHKLLQQVGKEVIQRQDHGKRQILIDTDEISDVLENDKGSRSVMGISLDISTIVEDMDISAGAFKSMRNLLFLSVYKKRLDRNDRRVHVPEDIDFPRLKLLRWDCYPKKYLPRTFRPEYLVELDLQENKLEKLWEGTQPLTNLKKMKLAGSTNLKELPDLSNATNLEELNLQGCSSLVEIPSSVGNLHKLELLLMGFCRSLQVVPTHFKLASLETVHMYGCWELRNTPDLAFSTNITTLEFSDTMLEFLPELVRLGSRLQSLSIWGSLYPIPDLTSEYFANRRGADIEKLPDCIKDLHGLTSLQICGCPKLASLPELPASLTFLKADNCESLETLTSFHAPIGAFFLDCLKLGHEARRVIIQQSSQAWLPGRNIPAEFDHRAIGNSLTIPSQTDEFRYCVVISPKQRMKDPNELWLSQGPNGYEINANREHRVATIPWVQREHLYIRHVILGEELHSDLLWEFSTTSKDIDIIECGFQILTEKTNRRRRPAEAMNLDQNKPQKTDGDEGTAKRVSNWKRVPNRKYLHIGYICLVVLYFYFIVFVF